MCLTPSWVLKITFCSKFNRFYVIPDRNRFFTSQYSGISPHHRPFNHLIMFIIFHFSMRSLLLHGLTYSQLKKNTSHRTILKPKSSHHTTSHYIKLHHTTSHHTYHTKPHLPHNTTPTDRMQR